MGFMATSRKYGICFTSKLVADWADHKQLRETQQDGTFLIQFTGGISCLTLKKKKALGGGGFNFPRNYLCKARLLYAQVGKTTAFRGMYIKTSNKREQFVLQHCRKTSLKAMLCARFTTQIKCLATNQIVPVTKSCCGVENSSCSAQSMPSGANL